MDAYAVIKRPLSTEKAVRVMEAENKLVFEVANKATKQMIKKSVENLFNVKVQDVTTTVTKEGKKRAYVTLKEGVAADIMTQMGLM